MTGTTIYGFSGFELLNICKSFLVTTAPRSLNKLIFCFPRLPACLNELISCSPSCRNEAISVLVQLTLNCHRNHVYDAVAQLRKAKGNSKSGAHPHTQCITIVINNLPTHPYIPPTIRSASKVKVPCSHKYFKAN